MTPFPSLTSLGRRVPTILQSEPAECGLACLVGIANFHGNEIALRELRNRFPISLKGMTLALVLQIADNLGMNARPIRAELDYLAEIPLPAILHWNLSHFVILTHVKGRKKRKYRIMDPAVGVRTLKEDEISRSFTGVAVEFSPSKRLDKFQPMPTVRITDLWSATNGTTSTLLPPIILSIVLQIITLIIPLFLEFAVETAIPSNNSHALAVVGLAFVFLIIMGWAIAIIRGRYITEIGASAAYQISSNLVRHLFRLSVAWLEKRHTADLLSRIDSVSSTTSVLSRTAIVNLIDGFLAIATLVIMFSYSPILALVPATFSLIYIITRLILQNSNNLLNRANINARAIEQGIVMENIRNASSIKAYGKERDRFLLWLDKKVISTNASMRVSISESRLYYSDVYLSAIENVVFFVVAYSEVIAGGMSIGAVFAFAAYKQIFINSISQAARAATDLKLLDVHIERISDIAYAEPERSETSVRLPVVVDDTEFHQELTLELRNVHYCYGYGEPDILRGINLSIRPGETLALAGRSGGGKTTLMRLMLGLLEPTEGEMLVGGIPLRKFGVDRWRSLVGYVAQNDDLFSGTLSENISFFDNQMSLERIADAAKRSSIHTDILAMPMQYETLCGDMGSTLSGGQKARILLARALYKNPSYLFVDEGTAHLDIDTERAVNDAIRSTGVSRVLIAHRPDTLLLADRVVFINDGRVCD